MSAPTNGMNATTSKSSVTIIKNFNYCPLHSNHAHRECDACTTVVDCNTGVQYQCFKNTSSVTIIKQGANAHYVVVRERLKINSC